MSDDAAKIAGYYLAAGDAVFAEAERDMRDPCTLLASRALEVPVESVTTLQRQIAKNLTFARRYGSSIRLPGASTARVQSPATAAPSRRGRGSASTPRRGA